MKPWRRHVYLLCLAHGLTAMGFTLVVPFLPLFAGDLRVTTVGSVPLWIGLILAAQPVTMGISAPVWGMVADRYGRKLMILRATLAGGLVVVAMALVQSVEQLFLLRLLQGLATGVAPAINAYVSTHVPRRHMGEALGWISTARWTGAGAGPILGGLLGDLLGFRASFGLHGLCLLLAGLMVLAGLPAQRVKAGASHLQTRVWAIVPLLWRTPRLKYLYLLSWLVDLSIAFTWPMAPLYVQSLPRTVMGSVWPVATVTGLMFGSNALAGALSAMRLGCLGDRIGANAVLILCAGASCLLFLPQAFVFHAWQLVVLQAVTGVAVGGLLPALAALMSRVSTTEYQGRVFGIEHSLRAAARALGPLAGSALAVVAGINAVYVAAALGFLGIACVAWCILGPKGAVR